MAKICRLVQCLSVYYWCLSKGSSTVMQSEMIAERKLEPTCAPPVTEERHTEVEAHGPKAGTFWMSAAKVVEQSATCWQCCCPAQAKVAENLNSKKPLAQGSATTG